MDRELLIETNGNTQKIFLQNGFWDTQVQSGPLHKHHYAEMHLVTGGSCRFFLEREEVSLKDGDLLVIPSGQLHGCVGREEKTRHTAFQIDLPAERAQIYGIPASLVEEFFRQIEAVERQGDYRVIASFISLLCSYRRKERPLLPRTIADERFLIREFFTHHYSEDVHLGDLASYLHRSERQTERLLLSHTGRTFREELTHTRMEIARHLLASGALSLRQIAEYVGYRSYAGFWKAMQREGFVK